MATGSEEEENPGSTVTQLLKENGGTIMDSLFRGLNRQLLPNSHIFSLAAVESTVVSILPGAPFFKRELFCGGAQTKEGWFKPTVLMVGQ